MNQELRMQVLLWVAFYGRKQVLEELACVEDVDIAVVERELQSIRRNVKAKVARKRTTRRRKTARELVQDAAPSDSIRSLVERLAFAYEGKGFLPDLWRVKQFLESQEVAASKIRSRADALPKVVRVLSRLPCDELERLTAQLQSGRNDLSVLTDQILGPATRRSTQVHGQQSVTHRQEADNVFDAHTVRPQRSSKAPSASIVDPQKSRATN